MTEPTISELASDLPPVFLQAVQEAADNNAHFVTSHLGFRTTSELDLLGRMVKYACLRGLDVHVVA